MQNMVWFQMLVLSENSIFLSVPLLCYQAFDVQVGDEY